MSLPDWNDLPAAARKAAGTVAMIHGVDHRFADQCALLVWETIRQHAPPGGFPLIEWEPNDRIAFEAYQIIGVLAHLTGTFEEPDVRRALNFFLDHSLGRPVEDLLFPWPRERIKPRVRVRAGRRVL